MVTKPVTFDNRVTVAIWDVRALERSTTDSQGAPHVRKDNRPHDRAVAHHRRQARVGRTNPGPADRRAGLHWNRLGQAAQPLGRHRVLHHPAHSRTGVQRAAHGGDRILRWARRAARARHPARVTAIGLHDGGWASSSRHAWPTPSPPRAPPTTFRGFPEMSWVRGDGPGGERGIGRALRRASAACRLRRVGGAC